MVRPHVIVHSMASADGRTDHFAGDVGLYYELAAGFPHDAILAGSGTMLAAAADHGIDLGDEDPLPPDPAGTNNPDGAPDEDDQRPLAIVIDAAGRLTRFAWLREMPYWRDVMVLCSGSTPERHLALLTRHRVRYLVVGSERVDLRAALTALAEECGVRRIRVDSGGTLNGALLRAGLVDEVSVLLAPYLVGGRSPRGLFVADDLPRGAGDLSGGAGDLPAGESGGTTTRLELRGVQRLRGDVVWLRYRVIT